jgi:hypothetical protein
MPRLTDDVLSAILDEGERLVRIGAVVECRR